MEDGLSERHDDRVGPNLQLTYDNEPTDWDKNTLDIYKDEDAIEEISKLDHTHHAGCGCKLRG